MTTITDVAAYILQNNGTMSTMKLEKLCFYSQAQSLSKRGIPLFDEDFQAWRNGPVSPTLFNLHRHLFLIHAGELDPFLPDGAPRLTDAEKTLIDMVCGQLASKTGNQLSERTHAEAPWRDARAGLSPADPCNRTIGKDSIARFYAANPVVR